MPDQLPFFGREYELQLLHNAWSATTITRTPQIVTLVAETGVGKSRIIQEFYRQLTVDTQWDPNNFWPDAFQSHATQLQVNPEFPTDYTPDGPPRFLWLGINWADNKGRSIANSLALPTLKEQVLDFSKQVKRFQSRWEIALQILLTSGKEITTTQEILKIIAGNLVPFSDVAISLFAPLIKNEFEREGKPTTLPDQLLELFMAWFNHHNAIPIIMWLDDAQWIDKEATTLFTQLMHTARNKRWPLLLIATCWPAEWIAFPDDFFLKHDATTIRELENAANIELQQLLNAAFPQLPHEQVTLIVNKAGGNFLTMIENIAELQTKPRYYFEQGNNAQPLSANGMSRITTWESGRQQRITQLFHEFDDDIQDFLARASHAGLNTQFLQRVLLRCHDIYPDEADVIKLIARCQKSLAVIIPVSASLHEFRDRGYFAVARQHFIEILNDFESNPLKTALIAELTERIQSAFDVDGNLCDPQMHTTSLRAAPSREQHFILELALTVCSTNTPIHACAFVANVAHSVHNNSWQNIRALVDNKIPETNHSHFDSIDWSQHVGTNIGWHTVRFLANTLWSVGLLTQAENFYTSIINHRRTQLHNQQSAITLRELSFDLVNAGRINFAQGHNEQSFFLFQEALNNFRQLTTAQHTMDDIRNLAIVLNDVGLYYHHTGNSTQAFEYFNESLTYCIQLVNSVSLMSDLQTLAVTLTNIGHIRREQGEHAIALTCYQQALHIYQQINNEQHNPDTLRNLISSSNNTGMMHEIQQDHESALHFFTDALAYCRELVALRGTPDDLHELSTTLNFIGRIHEQQRAYDQAIICFQESVDTCWQLNSLRAAPNDIRDLSIALSHLGRIHRFQGKFIQAIAFYQHVIELLQQLITTNTTLQDYLNLAEAMEYFQKVLTIKYNLVNTNRTPVYLRELINTLHMLGQLWLNKDDSNTSLQYYINALQYAQELIDTHDTDNGALYLSSTYDLISQAYEAQRNKTVALQYATQAYEIALQYCHRHKFTAEDVNYLKQRVHFLQYSTP